MKQIRIMAIVFTALMLAVLVFALCLGNSLSFRRRDIGEYKRLLRSGDGRLLCPDGS